VNVDRCGTLSAPGTYTLIKDVNAQASKVCFSVTAQNVVIDCQNFAIIGSNSKAAVYSSSSATTVKSCKISGFSYGVAFDNANGGRVEKTAIDIEGVAGVAQTGEGSASVADCTITNSGKGGYGTSGDMTIEASAISAAYVGAGNPRVVKGSSIEGRVRGIEMLACNGGSVYKSEVTGGTNGIYLEGACRATIAGNTIVAKSPADTKIASALRSVNSKDFINIYGNTFSSDGGFTDLVQVDGAAVAPLLYWNNFTKTSRRYIYSNAPLKLSYDVGGQQEGNIYDNVMSGSVQVQGTVASIGYPSLYVGMNGTGYPYSQATSQGKLVAPDNAADYAPLTPNYFNNSSTPPQGCVCGVLNTPNYVCNVTSDLNSTGTCFTVSAPNVTIKCNGHTINGTPSGRGVYSTASRTNVTGCSINGYWPGIEFKNGTGNAISSSKITGMVGIIFFNVTASRILGTNTTSNGGNGIGLIYSSGNLIDNVNAISTGQAAIQLQTSSGNTIRNCKAATESNNAMVLLSSGGNNVSNCTFSSDMEEIDLMIGSNANVFFRNTLLPLNSAMHFLQLGVDSGSSGNLFYWNNFTYTPYKYVFDANGGNAYNTTINGKPEGNIYANVISGAVQVQGNMSSSGFPALYIGRNGTGYPYGPANSQNKMVNATDYAPLTPFYFNNTTQGCVCGALSVPNYVCNVTSDLASAGSYCFHVQAPNITVECNGHKIIDAAGVFSEGAYVEPGAPGARIRNCNFTGFDIGIVAFGSSNITNTFAQTVQYNAILVNSNDTSLENATGVSRDAVGIAVHGGSRVSIIDSTAISTYGPAIELESINSLVKRATATTQSATALVVATTQNPVGNNTIMDSMFASGQGTNTSWGRTVVISLSGNNTLANNTIQSADTSATADLLYIINASPSGNRIYWNNFTAMNGHYIHDEAGTSTYTAIVNGRQEGNIYANVMNGSVQVQGNVSSSYGQGLYIGKNGTGYPYNSTTAQGKLFGAIVDYAPLTPFYYNYTAPQGCACGGLNVPNYICNVTQDLNSSSTCFSVTAKNVTILCNGHRITGVNNAPGSGVASGANGTVVKDCNIDGFDEAISFGNANNGKIVNTIANGTYVGITMSVSSNNLIQNSSGIGGYSSGIEMGISSNNNTLSGATGASGDYIGIYVAGSNKNTISGSAAISGGSTGLRIENAYNNTVIGSNGTASQGDAIQVAGGAGNNITNSRGASNSGAGIRLASSFGNKILNSMGTSDSGYGIGLASASGNAITGSRGISSGNLGISMWNSSQNSVSGSEGISSFSMGIAIVANSSRNTIAGSNGSSTFGYGMLVSSGSSSNSILNSAGKTNSGTGIALLDSTNNTMVGSSGTSNISTGIGIWTSYNNTVANCIGSSYYHNGMQVSPGSGNRIANSTFVSNSRAAVSFDNGAASNLFYNNTLASTSNKTLLALSGASALNTFYWNNFTQTGGLYINDSAGGNYYNASVNGKQEGNIYANVLNGSVAIQGNVSSSGFPSLYIGVNGTGYPYGAATAQGKVVGSATDYAPLTPNYFNNSSVPAQGCVCGVLNVPNYVCNVTQNLASNGTCFNVQAYNVTILCNGHSLAGLGSAMANGVYSNQSKTTVNGCKIYNYTYGIMFEAATSGTIINTETSGGNAVMAGAGIALGSNAAANSIINSRANGSYHDGTGIRLSEAYNNTIINSTGISNTSIGIHITNDSSGNILTNVSGIGTYSAEGIQLDNGANGNHLASCAGNAAAWGYAGILLRGSSYYQPTASNTLTNCSGTAASGSGIRLEGSPYTSIVNCTGSAGGGNGIDIVGSGHNTISGSTGTTNSSVGIGLSGSSYNTIANSRGVALYYGIFIGASSGNNSIISSNGTSGGYVGILVDSSSGNSITGSRGTSPSGDGIRISNNDASYNSITNSVGASASGNGIYIMACLGHNTITGSNAASNTGAGVRVASSSNNTFSNNTISSNSSELAIVQWGNAAASQNLFYWNNFTATGGRYINDSAGGNHYNATVNGRQEGNIYANVISGAVKVQGNETSSGFPSLYIGMNGTGYPYSASTAQGKVVGSAIDYAPLTPFPFNNSSVPPQGCVCGVLNVSNYVCNVTQDLASNGTCFSVTANNVTILCNGHSITGSGTGNGIFTNANTTTVKDCRLQNFLGGVTYQNSNFGYIGNITANFTAPQSRVISLNLSFYNTVTGINAASYLKSAIYLERSNYNNLSNANATAIAGAGILLSNSSHNTIIDVNTTGIPDPSIGYPPGLSLSYSNFNTLIRATGLSKGPASADGIALYESDNNNLLNSTGIGEDFGGISLFYSDNNSVINCKGASGWYAGIFVGYAQRNTIQNGVYSTGGSAFTASAIHLQGANLTTIISNVLNATGSTNGIAFVIDDKSISNTAYNNTMYSQNTLLYIDNFTGLSTKNLFYWNNFTATSGYYIEELSGGNYYNTTIDGKQEGNIYANVISGAVAIQGNQTSSGFPALYIGMNGTGYPYSASTAQGKIIGNATDYAPLTPYYFNNSSTPPVPECQCGVLNVPNSVCTLTQDLASNSTCFTVNAANVTIDCAGHKITGSGNSGYGIYSNQPKTAIKNCDVNAFYTGILIEGATQGTVENIKINSTSTSPNGFGIDLNLSSNNTITNATIYSAHARGIFLSTSSGNLIQSTAIATYYDAISLYSSSNFNNINGVNATSFAGYGTYVKSSSYNTINSTNSFGIYQGILVDMGSRHNRFIRVNATADPNYNGWGMRIQLSANTSVESSSAYGISGISIIYSSETNITGSTATGTSHAIELVGSSKNKIANSTLLSPAGTLLYMEGASSNNTVVWNNFTSTSGMYVVDSAGGNSYNATTPAGTNEGNIYANVMNGSVQVQGNATSYIFPVLYIGMNGSGYPYNSMTSQGKVTSLVADYAPLTPFYFSGNSTPAQGCVCGTPLNTPNYVCNVTQDLTSEGTCFEIQANNVTIECNGHSITEIGSGGTGIDATGGSNIKVRNCRLYAFAYGIVLQAVTFSNVENITIDSSSSPYLMSSGVRLIGSQYNTISKVKATTRDDALRLDYSDYNNISSSSFDIGANGAAANNAVHIIHSNYNRLVGVNGTNRYYPGASSPAVLMYDSSSNVLESCIGTMNGTITSDAPGISISDSSNNNILSNTKGISAYDLGIAIDGSSGNLLVNCSAIGSAGFSAYASNNTVLDACNASSTGEGARTGNWITASSFTVVKSSRFTGTAGALLIEDSSNSRVENSTMISTGGAALAIDSFFGSSTGNVIVNNTLASGGNLVEIQGAASGNTFYWNNFTATGGLYIDDAAGGNTYSTAINGHAEGNIYANVISGAVQVQGNQSSSGFPSLYIGINGTGFPYSASTSQGKIAGSAVDYAPLTPYYFNNSSVPPQGCQCGYLDTPNSVCTLTKDLQSNYTCFTVIAPNVTIDCNGHSITGSRLAPGATYGIYALKNLTTVRNCMVYDFTTGIRFLNVSNGKILNSVAHGSADYIGYPAIALDWADNNLIKDSAAIGVLGYGVSIGGSNNTLQSINASSVNQPAITFQQGNGNLLEASDLFSETRDALYIMNSSWNSIMNNRMLSHSSVSTYFEPGVIWIDDFLFPATTCTNNQIVGNSLQAPYLGSGSELVYAESACYDNVFYWNNFTDTGGKYARFDSPNYLNAIVNGQDEGNIYANVMSGAVQIQGNAASGYGQGLYVGTNGTGYPYNSSNSGEKLSGFAIDYAPLTPYYFNNSSVPQTGSLIVECGIFQTWGNTTLPPNPCSYISVTGTAYNFMVPATLPISTSWTNPGFTFNEWSASANPNCTFANDTSPATNITVAGGTCHAVPVFTYGPGPAMPELNNSTALEDNQTLVNGTLNETLPAEQAKPPREKPPKIEPVAEIAPIAETAPADEIAPVEEIAPDATIAPGVEIAPDDEAAQVPDATIAPGDAIMPADDGMATVPEAATAQDAISAQVAEIAPIPAIVPASDEKPAEGQAQATGDAEAGAPSPVTDAPAAQDDS
jgi:parallel beta-helix repeat protein